MKPVVTIQRIANYLGVSKGTVSLALRNNPRISATTRDRVKAAAEHLGYRPNPAVAAWMAHRRRANPDELGASIAFLNLWPDPAEWNASPWFTRFVTGARQRARALGFGFEEYWLAAPGMTAKRMSGILKTRGIQGVIVGSLTETGTPPALDWQDFVAVAQSHSLTHPDSPQELAGIDQGLERCGEVAVDLLVPQLHNNEPGPPSQPIIAQSRGAWRNGGSVRMLQTP